MLSLVSGAAVISSAVTHVRKLSTSRVESLTEDMVLLAQKGQLRGRVYGREPIFQQIISSMQNCRGMLLIHGFPGTGKTACIEEIVHRIKDREIPALERAAFFRLKPKEIRQPNGLMGQAERILYGSQQDEIGELIDELMKSGLEKRQFTFLIIDEIQALFDGGSFSLLIDRLAQMDQDGFMLIGMTSKAELLDQIHNLLPESGNPFERRVRGVQIPEMSESETISAFKTGTDELNREYFVSIQGPAIQAIVVLAKIYLPKERLPGSARKLLNEVASWKRSVPVVGSPELTSQDVCAYLSALSIRRATADVFSNYLVEWEKRQKIEAEFFDTHFPEIPAESSEFNHGYEGFLKEMEDQNGSIWIETHSLEFLKSALGRSRQKVRTIFLSAIFDFCQKYPKGIDIFKNSLDQLRSQTLLVVGAERLIMHRAMFKPPLQSERPSFSSDGSLSRCVSSASSMVSKIPGGRVLADAFAGLADQCSENSSRFNPSSTSVCNDMHSTILRELDRWLSDSSHRAILPISKMDGASQKMVAEMGYTICSFEKTPFLPVFLSWLENKYENRTKEWFLKVFFLALRFSEHKNFPTDLCDQICRNLSTIPESLPTNEQIEAAFSRHVQKKEEVLHFLNCFEQLESVDPIAGDLAIVSHGLFHFLEPLMPQKALLVKINDVDFEKSRYLARLVAKRLMPNGGKVIDFDLFCQCFPNSDEARFEYLGHSVRESSKTVILFKESQANPNFEQLLKRAHQLGCTLICIGSAKKLELSQSSPAGGYVNQLMDTGLSVLKSYLSPLTPLVQQARSESVGASWLDTAFAHQYENPAFTEEEFRVFFDDLWRELEGGDSPARKTSFLRGYFFLHQSRGLSFTNIRRYLSKAIKENGVNSSREVSQYLFRELGTGYKVSEQEMQFEIDPSLLPCLQRLKIGVQKIARQVFQIGSSFFVSVISRIFRSTEWIVAASSLVVAYRTIRPWIWRPSS